MGIFDTITVVLLILKYFGLIGITWFACFTPFLIGLGIVIILKMLTILITSIAGK